MKEKEEDKELIESAINTNFTRLTTSPGCAYFLPRGGVASAASPLSLLPFVSLWFYTFLYDV